jgi:hypothetical protein
MLLPNIKRHKTAKRTIHLLKVFFSIEEGSEKRRAIRRFYQSVKFIKYFVMAELKNSCRYFFKFA